MAKKPPNGSWLIIEELLERGDPAFLDELRACDDAERLAPFASKWFADKGLTARRFLLKYLEKPLNAYRHEPLVKRLFKLAEAAQDDAVMARFLVALDRSVRRVRRRRYHFENQSVDGRDAAHAMARRWQEEGAEFTSVGEWNNRFLVSARWPIERLRIPPGTSMPRGTERDAIDPATGQRIRVLDLMTKLRLRGRPPKSISELPLDLRKKLAGCQLFTVHTRHYLRRRAWRYFRKLGKFQPERYVPAVVEALKLYQDDDVADGLALLDNWGLTHVLFHHSPVLLAKTNGWMLAPDRKLSELTPAPIYEGQWIKEPRALLELVREANGRTVRQWALFFLRRENALANLPVEELIALLAHQDAEVAVLACNTLRQTPGLENVGLDRWLAILEQANPAILDGACELVSKHCQPGQATFAQAVQLAKSRPVPIARLGLAWLQSRTPATEEDCLALLTLTEAEAESVRGDILRWVRQVLGQSPHFRPDWVLELLDCRHENVRTEGWAWLQEEPRARDNVDLWRRLLESPYDDLRLKLVADLERRVSGARSVSDSSGLDAGMVRLLWAGVLLNIQRGNRAKPFVVGQIVRRLLRHPDDARVLLPILSVALRSLRGPEWRAGLAGVVQLVEQNPNLAALVRENFPELKMTPLAV